MEDTLIVLPQELIDANTDVIQTVDSIGGKEATFSIKESYDYECQNNQIQCIIDYAGQQFVQSTNFYFGKIGDNGTNGTDIVARVNVNGGLINKNQPLTCYVYRDANGNEKHF